MTNYEKYKDELIEVLATNAVGTCRIIYGLRTNKKTCPLGSCHEVCNECEFLNKQWLMAEAVSFDPSELKTGDKIRMRMLGTEFTKVYEVVSNSNILFALWLRESEAAEDKGFLISHNDIPKYYNVEEVIRND